MRESFFSKPKSIKHIRENQARMYTIRGWTRDKGRDSYECGAGDYLGEKNVQEIETEIEKRLDQQTEVVVAEFGSGAGNTSAELKNKYPQIIALSFDLAPIVKIKEDKTSNQVVTNSVNHIAADFEMLPVKNNKVDVGFSVWAYPYSYDKLKFLTEVFNSLKLGGVAYIHLGMDLDRYIRPMLSDAISRAGLNNYFKIDEITLKYTSEKSYVLKIAKPIEDINIDWKMRLKGVKEEDCSSALNSHYEKIGYV